MSGELKIENGFLIFSFSLLIVVTTFPPPGCPPPA